MSRSSTPSGFTGKIHALDTPNNPTPIFEFTPRVTRGFLYPFF
ncbi:MAG TPA: hypothetical protein VL689_08985 [Paraburkholderia sp.]|nr:hypothetical protein [Paraburkholderia sp.]